MADYESVLSKLGDDASMPIAVVGIGGRFPGEATNPEKFWDMIYNSRHALTEVPKDRFNIDAFYHPYAERQGTMNVRGGHYLTEDVGLFDAPFFSITAKEANAMDPQQRLALEVAYESLENAGMRMEDVLGSPMACYMASFTRDYATLRGHDAEDIPRYEGTGNGSAMISNRISWFFDLKGPSLSLDTACSSSLVALHLACQSIRTGETNTALVGGTNLILMPEMQTAMTSLNFLSPDSKSQSFDHKANGYSRGEGAAVIVIKSLADALRDGNTIRGVIRGTAVNQDGKTPGITLPSAKAQEELIRATYASAGLDFNSTEYFEAHGTGTAAGDPLEASAIAATISASRPKDKPLLIGSVKTNIGHMEGASGLAGLIKALSVLEKGIIPPNLWFEKANPRIPMDKWRLKVPTKLEVWPTKGLRRASVNSFGYGGTNAHCIIDDAYHYLESRSLDGVHKTVVYPVGIDSEESTDNSEGSNDDTSSTNSDFQQTPLSGSEISNPQKDVSLNSFDHPKLLVWTSHDQVGTDRTAKQIIDFVQASTDANIVTDLAFTFSEHRSRMPWKTYTVASTTTELSTSLSKHIPKPVRSSQVPNLCFIFTGQGAQWFAMGRELLAYPLFKQSLEAASDAFRALGSTWYLLDELLLSEEESRINESAISQPACTALQVALVDLLSEWNIKPSVVIGHSSGEIAAAYAKGAISRGDAWTTAYHRGHLSGSLKKKGTMLAVGLGEDDVQSYLTQVSADHGHVVVACINSPSSVTLSGDLSAIAQIKTLLDADNVFNRKLAVNTAYHSPHMQALADAYTQSLSGLKSSKSAEKSNVTMFSSVTGAIVDDEALATPQYWVSNMVNPVKFNHAVKAGLEFSPSKRRTAGNAQYVNQFVEVGPHSALQGPLKQILDAGQGKKRYEVPYVSVLSRGKDAVRCCLDSLGKLFQRGYPVDISRVNGSQNDNEAPRLLTNLPPFAWNHSTRYWYESAISAAFRHRKLPRYDLVGVLNEHSTEIEPFWTNYLRVSEAPWIEHHKVQGTILYPLAGMIVMAIEGARQIADPTKEIAGFQVRDVSVGKAMVLHPDLPTETKLQFRPWRAGSRLSDSFWHEFTISCRTRQGVWTQHCAGLVAVKYETEQNPTFANEEAAAAKRYHDEYVRLSTAGFNPDDPRQVYASLAELGLQWGPTFTGLVHISSGDYEAHCELEIPDTKKYMPEAFEYPHIVHPAALDAFIQMVIPASTPTGVQLQKAKIPRFIESLYISSKINSTPGTRFYGYSKSKPYGFNESIGTIVASNQEWKEPMVVIEGCRIVTLENMADGMSTDAAGSSAFLRKLGSHPKWDLDLEHLPLEKARKFFAPYGETVADADLKVIRDLELASFIFCKRILKQFSPSDAKAFSPHHQLFYEYMQHRYELGERGKLDCQENDDIDWLNTAPAFEDELLSRVSDATIDGKVLCHQGSQFDKILRGELEPLQVLMQDSLLTQYYRNALGTDKWNPIIAKFVQLLSHKKPLRILEVGAGTGGTTSVILSALGQREDAANWLESYTFTDISSGFFGAAAADFQEWSPFLEYKVLDIVKDPIEQGLPSHAYDLIVANNVLHATSSISACLAHCKEMLKPGGVLLLGELTTTLARVPMVFGTLSGWWSGEQDGRKWGPRLSEQLWDQSLREQGFSGLDMCFRDHSTDAYSISLMLSTADPIPEASLPSKFTVVVPENDGTSAHKLAATLSAELSLFGTNFQQVSISKVSNLDLADQTCISLIEANEPLLHTASEKDFAAVKHILLTSERTLWITNGAAMDSEHPEGNLIAGLGRTIRSEIPSMQLTTLDLDPSSQPDSKTQITAIGQVLRSMTKNDLEWEYALREEKLHSLRLVPDKTLNAMFEASKTEPPAVTLPFNQPGRALALAIKTPGMLDTFQFVDDNEYAKPLGGKELEIEVKAVGMNFHDVMIAMGQIADTDLGVECSGIVTRVGANVIKYKPGDRVITFRLGCYRTFLRNPEEMFQKMPDSMSFEVAASIPCIYSTVYYSLFDVARLQRGETVLIHAAAGGLGQAAIILSQYIGAKIFVTVSSEAKKQFLIETYGIPEDQIFNSRDHSFATGVKRMTGGRGVDVVLNSLAGEALRQTWLCVAPFGRFIELGKKDIVGNTGIDMSPFMNNIIFAGVNMLSVYRDNIPLFGRIIADVMKCLADGIIRPVQPLKVMNFSQIEEAFRVMQTGKHIGKMVLSAQPDDLVPIVPQTIKPYSFPENATYMIPGGLGGLGRAIAYWMVQQGARHIVFTSRSGATKPESQKLIAELHKMGAKTMAFACDISIDSELQNVLTAIDKEFPPVKGVITCAMQLQDVLFENMSVEDFHAAVRPKVPATRNLHDMLPKDMDFFVCLSSTGGIVGSRGQGNYNAGNTFQDAIANHRRAHGQSATSINLGVVLGIGITAQRGEILSYLKTGAMIGIHEQEVLATIQAAIAGQLPAQVVVGLATGGLLKQNGHDDPFWFSEPRFGPLRIYDTQELGVAKGGSSDDEQLQTLLGEAKTMAEATEAVCTALVRKLAKAMMIEIEDLDSARPANSYGVDSLVAVEVRAWIFKEVKSDVSVFEILSNTPLLSLAAKIASRSTLVSPSIRGDVNEA